MSREERLDRDYLKCIGLDYDSLDEDLRLNCTLRNAFDGRWEKQNDLMKLRYIIFSFVRSGKEWTEDKSSRLIVRYGEICHWTHINDIRKLAQVA